MKNSAEPSSLPPAVPRLATIAIALFVWTVAVPSMPLPAQNALFPSLSSGKKDGTISWEVSVKPATISPGGEVSVIAKYDIPSSWHIYAPDHDPEDGPGLPMELAVKSTSLTAVGKPKFPEPKIKKEPILDAVYRILVGKGSITQRYKVSSDASPGKLALNVILKGQQCDPSVCLPVDYETKLELTVVAGAAEPLVRGDDNLTALPLWLFILAMIGGGLFALAMPCTYPIIPITISYFTKQAETRRGSVLPLALAYGAGIILIFNVIGIVFAGVIQDFAFHWGTNLFFCLAFVVFAFSLFGLYNLRLPTWINQLTGKVPGVGGYLGVFLLGTVLVVSSFTCTAPVMGGLLILAVNDGGGTDLGRVSLGMTVFGATMAVPFVLLSLFPAKVRSLPSSGEWMHVLKVSLGFLELAAAIKFLSNVDLRLQWEVLPRELFLLLWAGIFVMASLYILNLFRLDGDSGASIGPKRMLAGLCTLLLGLYFFWGSLGFQLDWVSSALAPPYSAQRVAGANFGNAEKSSRETRAIVKDDIDGALALAKAEGKLVLVNFTGHT